MKEESRIEALEQELKILKNEIQSTLLEIREQILNHYYPELRAEEPLRSLSLPVRQNVGRPGMPAKPIHRVEDPNTTLSEIAAKGQVQPFSDIFLEDLEDEDDEDKSLVNSRRPRIAPLDNDLDDDELDDDLDDDNELMVDDGLNIKPSAPSGVKVQKVGGLPPATTNVAPKTREVDFRQLKQGNTGATTYNTSTVPAPNAVPQPARAVLTEKVETAASAASSGAPKANRQSFAALASWVSDGVTKVGKEGTLQVVETYATSGKLSNETKNSLVQLIALADDADPVPDAGTQEMLSLMMVLDQILRGA